MNDLHIPVPKDYLPTFNEDGVDIALMRWTLSLTPAERLQVLQNYVNNLLDLQETLSGLMGVEILPDWQDCP